jgi:hypothetical protein
MSLNPISVVVPNTSTIKEPTDKEKLKSEEIFKKSYTSIYSCPGALNDITSLSVNTVPYLHIPEPDLPPPPPRPTNLVVNPFEQMRPAPTKNCRPRLMPITPKMTGAVRLAAFPSGASTERTRPSNILDELKAELEKAVEFSKED